MAGPTKNQIGTAGKGNFIGNCGRDGAQTNLVGPGNTISGNISGLNSSKTAKIGNTGSGVSIYNFSHLNTVGWPGAANIIAGNAGAGVLIADPGTSDNRIDANFIGRSETSLCTLGNGSDGVAVLNGASGDEIGDSVDPAKGNLISCNAGNGIRIADASTQQIGVYGNKIGVNPQALTARPNGLAGVAINAASYVTLGNIFGANAPFQVIGANLKQGIYAVNTQFLTIDSGQAIGAGSGSPNMGNHLEGILLENTQNSLVQPAIIQLSGGAGITVTGNNASNNRLLPRWDAENGGLAIDLGNDGFSPNDPGDVDSGPNSLLNYPLVTHISGLTLFGTACVRCTIRVYQAIGNPTRPQGGFDALSGPVAVTSSDASGNWSASLPAGANPNNLTLQAAQSTDPQAFTNTSELSPLVSASIYLPYIRR